MNKSTLIKISLAVTFLAILQLVSTPTTHAAPQNEDASYYRNHGSSYIASGRYHEAIDVLSEAIAIDPLHASTFYNRGLAYYSHGDYWAAIADYGEAISLDPYYVAAIYNRGSAYRALGHYQEAIADFEQVIALDPHYQAAHDHLHALRYAYGSHYPPKHPAPDSYYPKHEENSDSGYQKPSHHDEPDPYQPDHYKPEEPYQPDHYKPEPYQPDHYKPEPYQPDHYKPAPKDSSYSHHEYKAPHYEYPCYTYHIVRHGEGLSQIGSHYGIPLHKMFEANPGVYHRPHYYLSVGQKICIPHYDHYPHRHTYPKYRYQKHSH